MDKIASMFDPAREAIARAVAVQVKRRSRTAEVSMRDPDEILVLRVATCAVMMHVAAMAASAN